MVNAAFAAVEAPMPCWVGSQRLHVANAGWARWTPVHLAAIVAHLLGGAGLRLANKGRVTINVFGSDMLVIATMPFLRNRSRWVGLLGVPSIGARMRGIGCVSIFDSRPQ
jgi:hypothetical protein